MGRFLESLLTGQSKGRHGRRAAAIALIALCALVLLLIVLRFDALVAAVQEAGLYLQYRFIQRALIVGVLVSLCAALLGVTLVLKRYSMIGDGLSLIHI